MGTLPIPKLFKQPCKCGEFLIIHYARLLQYTTKGRGVHCMLIHESNLLSCTTQEEE